MIILLTVLLMSIAVFVGRYETKDARSSIVDLVLPGEIKISPWINEDDGISYFFLPSYVNFDDIQILINVGEEITIDDRSFSNGDSLSGLTSDRIYMMICQNNKYNIEFRQSGNVATVFVSTATGSMDSIYKSKDHKEIAKITVIDESGNVDLNKTDLKIKGRGNVTWEKDKKPFAILFNEPETILGMKASSKWALMANGYDYSGIRNAIVLDTARNVGMYGTSEFEYVDLYLNGEYNGLYLICQTVDTIAERTDVDPEGLYLFTAEWYKRIAQVAYPLYAENDESIIDVRIPRKMSSDEKETAQSIINKVDTAIVGGSNKIDDIIDLDSWVKKYLIDEIFENYDSGVASSYFYTNIRETDPKIYAGPVWDYDNAIGMQNNHVGTTMMPEILFADQEYRSAQERILWYSELYSNPVFYNALVSCFEKDFLPQLNMLIEGGINELAQKINPAKRNDDFRWGTDSGEEYEYMIEFLSRRIRFLEEIWLKNKEYTEITYYYPGTNNAYRHVMVPKGSTLSSNPEIMDKFGESDKWYIDGTSEEYDFDLPVNDPIILVNISNNDPNKEKSLSIEVDKKLVAIGISIVSMFLVLLFIPLLYRALRKGVK